MSEQYSNAPTTTLNGGINNAVTSLIVTSATSFPSSGNFRIIIDSEIMLVTAVSGTTFTVTRGAESSTAASHSNGATIAHILTAGALDTIRTDLVNSGLFANRPSATKAGNLYLPTDGYYYSRDNGSSWDNFGPIVPIDAEAVIGNFAWVSQGSATAVTTNGGIFVRLPGAGSQKTSMLVQSKPGSTPFKVTLGWTPCFSDSAAAGIGLVFYDSSSGKFVIWAMTNSPTNLAVQYWNSVTSFSSSPASTPGIPNLGGMPPKIQIGDDGTNFTFSYSQDGVNFIQKSAISRTAFLSTYDKVGFAIGTNTSVDNGCLIWSYKQG